MLYRLVSCTVAVLYAGCGICAAFVPPRLPATPSARRPSSSSSVARRPSPYLPRVVVKDDAISSLFAQREDGDISDDDDIEKKSASRAGGRASWPSKNRPEKKEKKTLPGWLLPVVLPLLALWFASQALFGGLFGSSSDFVYYQSSVVESRTYGADGKVQTSRKESVQSNLPSLLEQRQRQQSDDDSSASTTTRTFLLDQEMDRALDRAIDREIEQEMQSIRRFQRTMMDDFF